MLIDTGNAIAYFMLHPHLFHISRSLSFIVYENGSKWIWLLVLWCVRVSLHINSVWTAKERINCMLALMWRSIDVRVWVCVFVCLCVRLSVRWKRLNRSLCGCQIGEMVAVCSPQLCGDSAVVNVCIWIVPKTIKYRTNHENCTEHFFSSMFSFGWHHSNQF